MRQILGLPSDIDLLAYLVAKEEQLGGDFFIARLLAVPLRLLLALQAVVLLGLGVGLGRVRGDVVVVVGPVLLVVVGVGYLVGLGHPEFLLEARLATRLLLLLLLLLLSAFLLALVALVFVAVLPPTPGVSRV